MRKLQMVQMGAYGQRAPSKDDRRTLPVPDPAFATNALLRGHRPTQKMLCMVGKRNRVPDF